MKHSQVFGTAALQPGEWAERELETERPEDDVLNTVARPPDTVIRESFQESGDLGCVEPQAVEGADVIKVN